MATHKKTPLFIRIKASDQQVVGINPHHLSSFNIVEKAKYKYQDPTDKAKVEQREADSLFFYFPSGTGLTYRVGLDITQEDFNYICGTLIEFMYLNEAEFKSRGEAMEAAKMEDWNRISKENETKLTKETPNAPEA